MDDSHPGQQLAEFAASLRADAIPAAVLGRAEDFMIDWLGSALAGKGARPVETIARFAERMGPADGPSEVLIHRRGTSPLVAAMANAAASHVAEQDDVHNGSVFHPATVVFPPALAVAQALGRSGDELLAAVVAGYEVGIRVGEFLGRSHYKVFHTTGTAGTLAAAAAVGNLLRLDAEQMAHAFGSAGTQAAGLWEFLRDAADSKQLHTAHAASAGLTAAYLAADGFTGARRILDGAQGMAAGMSSDADPSRLRRSARHALGAARDLVQVPRLLPPHASGGRRARRDAGERPERRRHRRGHRPGAPGRHRRARAGHRPADRAPVEVLDGHGARPDRRARPRRPDRLRCALARSRESLPFASA